MNLFARLKKKKASTVMGVKVKKLHPKAIIPTYAKHGDAGLDLTAVTRNIDNEGNVVYSTGLSFDIPQGYMGMIYPIDSTSKQNIILTNCVEIIYPNNPKEVILKYKPLLGDFDKYGAITRYAKYAEFTNLFRIGRQIARLVVVPCVNVNLIEVN